MSVLEQTLMSLTGSVVTVLFDTTTFQGTATALTPAEEVAVGEAAISVQNYWVMIKDVESVIVKQNKTIIIMKEG